MRQWRKIFTGQLVVERCNFAHGPYLDHPQQTHSSIVRVFHSVSQCSRCAWSSAWQSPIKGEVLIARVLNKYSFWLLAPMKDATTMQSQEEAEGRALDRNLPCHLEDI
jgi:hypothetical protein